jgi:hypothetical protein
MKSLTPKTQMITIQTTEAGPLRVVATVVGKYAVHLTSGVRNGYAITHVQTGICVRAGYERDWFALEIARQLNALPIRWFRPGTDVSTEMIEIIDGVLSGQLLRPVG